MQVTVLKQSARVRDELLGSGSGSKLYYLDYKGCEHQNYANVRPVWTDNDNQDVRTCYVETYNLADC